MPIPQATYEQLYGQSMFIHASGKHFTHACCDCGSAHNIKLSVLNAEEIEVTYYKNQKATAEFRAMPTHGVLISESLSHSLQRLVVLMESKKNKEARRLLRLALKDEREFQLKYANGDFLP